ncbi:hypothetical protein EUZ85_16510 [Hahella sp. KA22]|uniref:hypothetical protein n=1 Tax=Hahella sp. KA22 TaxID=1628392 RepID=UPI000FDD4263|nr:hypothetical protein [Hahella sp. KA22]AZZ92239.1 hypothetical protein ENC22_13945 [Hahella sp. KA22]QAY55610.1 hypothetical protein EUZ85_16510 [Hahella sp. KA22]
MKPSNRLEIDTLDNEWRDKDSVMLHACFQILKDCVNKERLLDGYTDWESDEKHRNAKAEIEFLYHWWISYSKPAEADFDNYELENEMLVRLINVRWALWT